MENLVNGLDKVMVLGSAMRALDGSGVLAVKVERGAWIHDGAAAILAGSSESAAGHSGEDVVGVHGAEHERRAVPRPATRHAAQIGARPLQTAHADGVQIQQLVVGQHLQVASVALRRQEEGAVDQWVAVVHRHIGGAAHALDVGHLMRTQVGQNKAARLVVAVRAFVLHLDVVRILLVPRQDAERREIRPALEDVTSCRLLGVSKKLEAAFLDKAPRGQRRSFSGARRAAARAREARRSDAKLRTDVRNNATHVLLLLLLQRRLLRQHLLLHRDITAVATITYVT